MGVCHPEKSYNAQYPPGVKRATFLTISDFTRGVGGGWSTPGACLPIAVKIVPDDPG